MATTREIAIRIVAEMGDFQQSIQQVTTQLQNLGKTAGAETVRGFKQMEKAAADYAGKVEDLGKQEASTATATAEAIVRASKKGAESRIKDSDRVLAGLTKEKQAILHATVEVEKARTAAGGKVTQATRETEAKVFDALQAAGEKEIQLWRGIYAERIKLAKGNAHEELRLESELAQKEAALQGRVNQASKGAQQRRAPFKTEGPDRKLERGENAATISASLQSFNVAGLTASLGPAGAAAGIVFDQLKGLVSVGAELAKKAEEEKGALTKLSAAFTDNGHAVDEAGLDRVRVQLSALERPADMSRKQVFELAQSLAQFVPPEGIKEATKTMIELSHIEPGIDLKDLGQALSDVSDATGDFNSAADLTAAVAHSLKADSITPLADASKALGQVLPQATVAIGDQGRAAKEGAALFAGLVAAHTDAGAAASIATKTFKGLNDVVNDPNTLATISKKLPAGLDLTSLGLEKGNVSVTKFMDAIVGMGPAGDEIAAILGPKLGGEAMQLLSAGARMGNKSLTELADGFGNVAGQASKSAAMQETGMERQEAAMHAFAEDAQLNLGRKLTSLWEGSQDAATGFMASIASFDFSALGPFGSQLGLIRDLFVDSQVEAERAFDTFNQSRDVAEGLDEVRTSLAAVGETQGVQAIVGQLQDVEKQSPTTAAAIKQIAADVNLAEPEKLAQINEQLSIMADNAAGQAMSDLSDAIKQAQKAEDDAIQSTNSWATQVEDSLIPSWFPLKQVIEDATQLLSGGNIAQQLDTARQSVDELTKQYRAAKAAGEDTTGLAIDLVKAQKEVVKLSGDQSKATSAVVDDMSKTLAGLEAEAKLRGENFDRQEELNKLFEGADLSLREQPEIMAEVRKQLEAGGAAAGDMAKGVGDAAAASDEQAGITSGISDQLSTQDETLKSMGISQKEGADAQIAQAEAIATSNDALLTQLDAQIAAIDAAIKGEITREEAVKRVAAAEEEVNRIKADAKAAAETGKVTATATAAGPKLDTSSLEAFRDKLVETRASLIKQNETIREGIKGLREHGGAAKDAAKGTSALQKAQDEATLSTLEGRAKDEKSAQLARDHAIEAAAGDRDAIAAANLEYSTKLREIVKKDDAEREKDRKAVADKMAKDEEERYQKQLKKDEDAVKREQEAYDRRQQAAEGRLQAAEQEADAALNALLSAMDTAQGAIASTATSLSDTAAQIAAIRRQSHARELTDVEIDAARVAAGARTERLIRATGGYQTETAAQRRERVRNEEGGPSSHMIAESMAGIAAAQRSANEELTASLGAITHAAPEVIRAILQIGERLDAARQEAELLTGALGSTLADLRNMDPTNVREVANAIAAANLQASRMSALLADTVATSRAEIVRQQDVLSDLRQQATEAASAATDLDARAAAAMEEYARARTGGAQNEAYRLRDEAAAAHQAAGQLADAIATNEAAMAPAMHALEAQTAALAALGTGGISAELQAALLTVADTSDEWTDIQSKLKAYQDAIAASQPPLDAQAQRTKDLADLTDRLAAASVRHNDAVARGDQAAADRFATEANDIARAYNALKAAPLSLLPPKDEMARFVADFKSAMDLVNGYVQDAIKTLDDLRKAGTAGERAAVATMAAVDLTQKIGEALLNNPDPNIAMVGAIMVGGALIAKAIKAIADMFSTPAETAAEQTERQLANEARVNKLLEDRHHTMDLLTAAGDIHNDQAREQLNLLQQQIAAQQGLAGLSLEQLQAGADHAAEQAKYLADLKAAAQYSEKFNDQDSLLTDEAINQFQNLHNLSAGTFGSWEDFYAFLDSEIHKAEGEQEKYNGQLDRMGQLHEAAKQSVSEEIGLLELRKAMGESELSILQKEEAVRRRVLGIELQRIGDADAASLEVLRRFQVFRREGNNYVVDLSRKTSQQIRDMIDALASLPVSQLTQDAIDAAQAWLDAGKAVDALGTATEGAAAASDDLYDKEKQRLELLHKLGRLTDDEYKAQMKALYEERLAYLDNARLQLTTVGDLLDNENARLQVESDLADLMNEQNSALSTQDEILVGLVRKRQQLLESLRLQAGGGTLTPAQQAQLDAATAEAVDHMKVAGASEEDIAKFLASLPKFEEGGIAGARGPEYVKVGEKGPELILPADITRMVQARSFYNSPEARIVTAAATRSAAAAVAGTNPYASGGVTFGDINITLPPSWSPADAARMGPVLGQSVVDQVNRAIQSGEISLRR